MLRLTYLRKKELYNGLFFFSWGLSEVVSAWWLWKSPLWEGLCLKLLETFSVHQISLWWHSVVWLATPMATSSANWRDKVPLSAVVWLWTIVLVHQSASPPTACSLKKQSASNIVSICVEHTHKKASCTVLSRCLVWPEVVGQAVAVMWTVEEIVVDSDFINRRRLFFLSN